MKSAGMLTGKPPAPGRLIVLAGDYMSMPYTEGAAESGVWAAQLVTDAANRRQPGAE